MNTNINQTSNELFSNYKLFSEIGTKPITDRQQLIIAGGRHRFSRLCGFLFKAPTGQQYAMAFICKLRSKINRQQKKQVGGQWTIPSRWFFLTHDNAGGMIILNKKDALKKFNFNVDEFFATDIFAKGTRKLQKIVKNGLAQATKFAESIQDVNEQLDAMQEISAIELSIPLIILNKFEDKSYNLPNVSQYYQ